MTNLPSAKNIKDLLKNDEFQGNKEPLHEAYAALRQESGNEVDTGNRGFQQVINIALNKRTCPNE